MAALSTRRDARPPRSPLTARTATVLAVFFLAAFLGFLALGGWQVQRRAWKLALIERVEQRVHAPASAAPGPRDWPAVSAARDEYRHVSLRGRFLHDRETLVQAATARGAGFWVLTPLMRDDGTTVVVNRGFVPPENRAPAAHGGARPEGTVEVAGLLRLTEPGGGFLRSNDPAGERWYSRDVAAIATARGLQRVAPYFVDAEAGPATSSPAAPSDAPVAGLTVIAFPNSHLSYALTWFALAAMVLAGAAIWVREEMRLRARHAAGAAAARRDGKAR